MRATLGGCYQEPEVAATLLDSYFVSTKASLRCASVEEIASELELGAQI
jgi:hypothetical protein